MKLTSRVLITTLCSIALPIANAAVGLDRTRLVYNESEKSISISIHNANKQLPFLAQASLENKDHKKEGIPFAVLPPLQRLEPDSNSVVRIEKMADVRKLPQDRESVFYFNLREIPPKSDKPNVMQIALQTQIKMFYRPKSIQLENETVWQDQLIMYKTPTGFKVENPTPYHITVTGMAKKVKEDSVPGFGGFMIEPKSTMDITFSEKGWDSFVLTYINDYGAHPELLFMCKSDLCVVKK